jgi:alpha-L-fucosidase
VKQLFFTRKPDALYAITTGWLAPEIVIRNIKVPDNVRVTMLGVAQPVKAAIRGSDLVINPPALLPQDLPCRDNYTFKIPGGEITRNP